ncbi:hypothetical protein D3C77_335780 [compost metagenome]
MAQVVERDQILLRHEPRHDEAAVRHPGLLGYRLQAGAVFRPGRAHHRQLILFAQVHRQARICLDQPFNVLPVVNTTGVHDEVPLQPIARK